MKQDFAQFKAPLTSQFPETLPAGERLVWQGKPGFAGLAWRAFHIREVVIYFGLLMAWRLWSSTAGGVSVDKLVVATGLLVLPAICSIAVLSLLAWLFSRAATYTITSKRVLLQFGVALPMTLTIPLDKISNAALKTYSDGSGDIPLTLTENKGSFALLWPHVRPWRLRAAQPMLRSVPDAATVAAKLADVLKGQPGPAAIALSDSAAGQMSATMPAIAAA